MARPTYLFILLLVSFLFCHTSLASPLSTDKIIIKPQLSPLESHSLSNGDSQTGIALAVSGGGARGLAFLGVLKALEKEHIKINFIAGVSMGGIIGGLYSCGYTPEEIERIALDADWGQLLSPGPLRSTLLTTQKGQPEKSLIKIRFHGLRPVMPRAITAAQNLSFFLEKLTAKGGIRSSINFDYLNPPLRIVCTDFSNGDEIVISSGNLGEALRATMAAPVAFTPVEIGGRLLVDGGLVDPIPVDVVRENVKCPVVAVNTSSALLPEIGSGDVIDVADQTTTIMSMDRKQKSMAQADLTITPDLHGKLATNFSNLTELIDLGEKAADAAIPDIKKLISEKRDKVADDPEYKIVDSRIVGLQFLPKTFFLTTFEDNPVISRNAIESNLEKAYSSGYLADCWAELVPEMSSFTLEYHLIDNSRIKSIEFSDSTIFPNRELLTNISLRSGMIFNHKMADNDKKALEKYYINAGFTLARITAQFDVTTGILLFKIDEGRINKINVDGNDRTHTWVITRHIPFRPGSIFRQPQADRAIEDIYSTDLFESIKFIAVPDSAGVNLHVKVTEKPFNFLRAGAGFDSEYGSRAFFDLVDDNLFGTGQEFFLSGKVGEKKRSAAVTFQADRILRTLFTYSFVLDYREFKQNYYLDHKYQGYFRQFSKGGEISLGMQFPRLGGIAFVTSFRQFNWDQPDKSTRQNFTRFGFGFKSVVDTRDALSFPESGKYHLVDLEFASDVQNEKTAYTKFFTSLEAYYALSRRLNIHPKIAIGASSDFMPYFDEFSLGGPNNFIGLHEDEFLGDKLLLGNIDLRFKIINRLYLSACYNAGNIWNKLERVRLSRLRYSAGLGLGVKTPFGPIEIWYGRTSTGLDAFYLKVGYDW
jgi:NTE family protein